jgi:thiamine-phosphate pyrophosphorylase
MKGYCFITDAKLSKAGNLHDVQCAEDAGVSLIQYRNKNSSSRDMYHEALSLRAVCKKSKLLINDRVDIALAAHADGVHLGQDDIPLRIARRMLGTEKIIGITAHSVKEAIEAEKNSADYIGFSPVFATLTKPDAGVAAGIQLLEKVKKAVRIPVIAIGGINLGNAAQVIKAGADGLCAISAVVTKDDVKSEILKFQKLFG